LLRFGKRVLRWLIWRMVQRTRILFFCLVSIARSVDGAPIRHQLVQLVGAGRIAFDHKVQFGVAQSPSFFSGYAHLEARAARAEIKIGARSWLNNSFTAIAETGRIAIGDDCLVGHNVTIYGSDFHPLAPSDRTTNAVPPRHADVTNGNNVFLGSRSTILRGTKIGHGCVVAAGAVVSGKFSSATLIAGNPAKAVRSL